MAKRISKNSHNTQGQHQHMVQYLRTASIHGTTLNTVPVIGTVNVYAHEQKKQVQTYIENQYKTDFIQMK